MSHQVIVRRLGLQPYTEVLESMRAFTGQRDELTTDELWVLQHEPVFTLGQAGRLEHVLAAGSIPVIKVERGGQVTYHGPGQIVAYPLFDLRRLGMGVRELVNRLEQAIIDTLEHWNIIAVRRPGAPGVYVADAKVGALGLRVRRGCSFHGLAFNVNMDLEPFLRINPCGYQGLRVTQVIDLGGPGSLADVEEALIDEMARQFGFVPQQGAAESHPLAAMLAAPRVA